VTCTHIEGAMLCTGGKTLKLVDGKGKLWSFEMHPYCGPMVLTNKTGEPMDPQPPEKSPFWRAVSFWAQQGEKLDKLGVCEWVEPKADTYRHIGGNNYVLETRSSPSSLPASSVSQCLRSAS
jgi:hypothetical protein